MIPVIPSFLFFDSWLFPISAHQLSGMDGISPYKGTNPLAVLWCISFKQVPNPLIHHLFPFSIPVQLTGYIYIYVCVYSGQASNLGSAKLPTWD